MKGTNTQMPEVGEVENSDQSLEILGAILGTELSDSAYHGPVFLGKKRKKKKDTKSTD